MDNKFFEKGILEPFSVLEGTYGYKLRPYFDSEGYVRYIVTHIICGSSEESVKKGYTKKVVSDFPSHCFDVTEKGLKFALEYMEEAGFEQWIYDLVLNREGEEFDVYVDPEEANLTAEQWYEITESEVEFYEEHKEELEAIMVAIEEDEAEFKKKKNDLSEFL